MEKISQYIEKLLARHDYVVIPGFGGFVVQFQSAEIENNVVFPPCGIISYNPLMLHNDGLLSIEISHALHINYRAANELVNREVEDLKTKIKANKTVHIGQLGSFNIDESQNLIFSPEKSPFFLPQNLGLYPLNLHKPLINNKNEIRITVTSGKFYNYAAAVLLIVSLFISTPRLTDVRHTNSAGLTPDFILKSDKIKQHVESTSTAKMNLGYEIKKQEVLTPVPENNYHVIVASLETRKSADIFCKSLNISEYKNAHILVPAKIYRVAIESFSDKDEAIEYMENLRKTDKRFDTAWVLCD